VPKYAWDSIDEAWVGAWCLWALGKSMVTTPYRCNVMRLYRADLRRRPHPDPRRWAPVMIERIVMVRANAREHPCGGWHLTRQTNRILPGTTRP
jgi:hypothetical protein